MKTKPVNRPWPARRVQAFSLVELMTAVAIMVIIIFALYQMFAQTQKALRANVTQVDVLESGRATAEMLGRELAQLTASDRPYTTNIFARMIPSPPLIQMDANEKNPTPLRTNLLQEYFFLSRQGNNWIGTGYRVMGSDNGVGTLYRYSIITNYYSMSSNLVTRFINANLATNPVTGLISTNFNRVADGIVHFRLTAYDPDGRRMGWETTNISSAYRTLRLSRTGTRLGLASTAVNLADSNVSLQQDPMDPNRLQTQFAFTSNAVPSYVELELGVLEPAAYKQYQGLEGTSAGVSFLQKQASKVHLFRQRIPIRTAQQ